MSILSSNKISIRQTPVTKDILLKYGFKPTSLGWVGIDWTDKYSNILRVFFKDENCVDIDYICMSNLSIPHGFLDLYEGNRLKNLGQLLDLIWTSNVMTGFKEREILQNYRIQYLRHSLK